MIRLFLIYALLLGGGVDSVQFPSSKRHAVDFLEVVIPVQGKIKVQTLNFVKDVDPFNLTIGKEIPSKFMHGRKNVVTTFPHAEFKKISNSALCACGHSNNLPCRVQRSSKTVNSKRILGHFSTSQGAQYGHNLAGLGWRLTKIYEANTEAYHIAASDKRPARASQIGPDLSLANAAGFPGCRLGGINCSARFAKCEEQEPNSPHACERGKNAKGRHDPLSVRIFSRVELAKAGYDWRIILGIAVFWIGGLIFNYFLVRVVTRREIKQGKETNR